MVTNKKQKQRIADLIIQFNLIERMELDYDTERLVGFCPSSNCFTPEKSFTIVVADETYVCNECGFSGTINQFEQFIKQNME